MKKVFYDGNCPICNREIELYKRLNKNKSVKSNLVGHPSLVGVIQKTVRPADEAGASWELESCIEWDSIDDRVDGMIRRNLETFITQSLEKVKKQAESLG